MASPVSVVSREYCFPDDINLKIDTENGVTYKDNYKHFIMKKVSPSLHHRRVLQDADGNTIVTLYKKKMSMQKRWEVYEGENSDDSNNLLFSVKASSILQRKIRLDVFLANNSAEKVCDFKIKVTGQSCVIYAGEDTRIIAEVVKVNIDSIVICVYSNIDYAFIVSLVFILDTMIKDSEDPSRLELTNVAIQTALGLGGISTG